MMIRHKRRNSLSSRQQDRFKTVAETFHKELQPLFRDLVPTSPGYRALNRIADAIDAAYEPLEVKKPERLGLRSR